MLARRARPGPQIGLDRGCPWAGPAWPDPGDDRQPTPAICASSGKRDLPCREEPLPEDARGLLQLRASENAVRRRDHRELLGVPGRVAGAAGQAAGLSIERLESSEGAGQATRDGLGGRVDDGLDVVLPSDGEMLLERGDRVEVG